MSDVRDILQQISRAIADDLLTVNEWEEEFIQSCGRLEASGRPLSDRQDEILEGIWKRIT